MAMGMPRFFGVAPGILTSGETDVEGIDVPVPRALGKGCVDGFMPMPRGHKNVLSMKEATMIFIFLFLFLYLFVSRLFFSS